MGMEDLLSRASGMTVLLKGRARVDVPMTLGAYLTGLCVTGPNALAASYISLIKHPAFHSSCRLQIPSATLMARVTVNKSPLAEDIGW